VKFGTIAGYLIGSRQAIVELSRTRWSLVVGLMFVLSGGLARYYDSAYLPEEWTTLLRGVTVSVGNSFILYSLLYLAVGSQRGANPSFWKGYISFLGLFWMTAPMAWLYAVPYERFLSPVNAIHANLYTLAAVSLWRVLLVTRVLAVTFEALPVAVFFIVMLFADVALFLAGLLAAEPVLDLMGGLHQTEVERAIAGSVFTVRVWTVVSSPVWIIGAIVGFWALKKQRPGPAIEASGPRRPSIAVAVLAMVSIVGWTPVLVRTQKEQWLRYSAETKLRAGQVEEAFGGMSEHDRTEYPPVWDPPPRRGFGETEPSMTAIRSALASNRRADWVEHIYLDKSWRQVLTLGHMFQKVTPRELLEWMQDRGSSEGDLEGVRFHAMHDSRFTDADKEALWKVADLLESPPRAKESEHGGSGS